MDGKIKGLWYDKANGKLKLYGDIDPYVVLKYKEHFTYLNNNTGL